MNVTISDELKQACRTLKLAVIEANVKVEKSSPLLLAEIEKRAAEVKAAYALDNITTIPEVAATRNTYKQIGKDPSRYRGSAESLMRRISQGKGLYKVNNIVDINNLVSIVSRHPVGSYDLDNISSEVIFGVGKEGETYKGIGKEVVNIAGLPVFIDVKGPYGSPTSDSERAMITEKTENIAMVIISFSGKGLEEAIDYAVSSLRSHAFADNLDISVIS